MPTQRSFFFSLVSALIFMIFAIRGVAAAQDDQAIRKRYASMSQQGGDAVRGKKVFNSKEAACSRCHVVVGRQPMAGPNLGTIGDKYTRKQLIQSVLEPSARIHPDFATTQLQTLDGRVVSGVLVRRTKEQIELYDAKGERLTVKRKDVDAEKTVRQSLMPAELHRRVSQQQFKDLISYLESLKQPVKATAVRGLVTEIPRVAKPIRLVPFHEPRHRFDHPVWIVSVPGAKDQFVVVEQKTRQLWRLVKSADGDQKKLFLDLSKEATTGQFEGVMCVAFHPQFRFNRKYYVNHHVRNQGSHFSPVIIERKASADLTRDSGMPSRRLLQIPQDTDLHWGGMLAFGPDGYLYIGAGDAGPQEDPMGHGQAMNLLIGKILRIDVDSRSAGKPYGIPATNPFIGRKGVRPEIFAYGFRMPWRFSWDRKTRDLWVGEIGQNLFEEVSIVRIGENHGWNVFEGFTHFSDRYRRNGEKYTPPVLSYRRKHGVSVTGGYVYRGDKNSSYYGAYIFADFESRRIFAATQKGRKLIKIRQIGVSPQKPSSFGIDADGELFLVGYEGTIYRVNLGDSVFE